MAWRETVLRSFGPGLMGGVTLKKWTRLLVDNHFDVSPKCWARAMAISLQSGPTSVLQLADRIRFGSRLKDVVVPAPVFVLGHWRQGTTHLHNLLTIDQRYAFPNNYQCLYPCSFLTAEKLHSKAMEVFLPRTRPMDNVEWRMASPQEDEFAMCVMNFKSPCMGWVFPRRRNSYDRYLTMRDVADAEITEWKECFMLFLKKLTFLYGRPVILKSPPHTARIKLLLEMFPDAKFVHIHRNPYDVFHSTRKMLKAVSPLHRLQIPSDEGLDEWILGTYCTMYDAYFEERSLIPAGHLYDVGFEHLEQDPIGQIHAIYKSLQLPDVSVIDAELQSYVKSIADYRKNSFPEFPPELQQRISTEWNRSFEEWKYPCR